MQFGKGRLGSLSNANATTNYTSFDGLGNVLASNQMMTGETYSFTYTYNLAGSLTNETYPSGRKITTGYDGANRSNAVTGLLSSKSTPYTSNFTFAPQGCPTLYQYGNNLYRQISYNNRLQMGGYIDLINNDPKSELLNVTLDWGTKMKNDNGNLQSATYNNGGPGYPQFLTFTQSYGYDSVNRTNSVSDTGGWSRAFQYDAYGNMWVTSNSGVALAGNTPGLYGREPDFRLQL